MLGDIKSISISPPKPASPDTTAYNLPSHPMGVLQASKPHHRGGPDVIHLLTPALSFGRNWWPPASHEGLMSGPGSEAWNGMGFSPLTCSLFSPLPPPHSTVFSLPCRPCSPLLPLSLLSPLSIALPPLAFFNPLCHLPSSLHSLLPLLLFTFALLIFLQLSPPSFVRSFLSSFPPLFLILSL